MAELGPCMALEHAMESLETFDLVVIGPEQPLVDGLADDLRGVGRRGVRSGRRRRTPRRLEGVDEGGPRRRRRPERPPRARSTRRQEAQALAYLETLPGFYVVKTDGLAAGKGVVVTESLAEARDAVREYLSGAAFGDAGRTLVIEEGLTGPELSLLVLCDGSTHGRPARAGAGLQADRRRRHRPEHRRHGRVLPGADRRPALVDEMMNVAVEPTLAALAKRDIEYRGVLYAGLMLTPEGTKVLEYNVRFGDPECQVVIPRLGERPRGPLRGGRDRAARDPGRVLRRRVRRRRARLRGLPGAAPHRRRDRAGWTRSPRSTTWSCSTRARRATATRS